MSIYLICIYFLIGTLVIIAVLFTFSLKRNINEKSMIENLKQKKSTIYIKYDVDSREITINNKYTYMDFEVGKYIVELSKKDEFAEAIKLLTKEDSLYNCENKFGDKIYYFSFGYRGTENNNVILRCDYNLERTINTINLKSIDEIKEYHNNSINKNACLYYLNIKEFNGVNQRYGQKCGDYVLEVIKNRFSKMERNNLLCSYLGADQFAIYYNEHHLNRKKAMNLIKDINKKITKPVDVGCINLDLVFGVGVCVGTYADLDEFIRCAYIASDYAKKRKNYNIVMYNETMKLEDDMMNTCERELNSILENKEIDINYNPVFYYSKSKFIGYISSPSFSSKTIKYESLKTYARREDKEELLLGTIINSQLISYLKKRPKKTSKLFLNLKLEELPVFLETYLSNASYSDCKIVICLNVKKGYEMLNKFSYISSTISKIIEEGIEFALEINYSNMYNYDYILKNANYLILDDSIVSNMNSTLAKNKFLNIIELAKTYELELFAASIDEYIHYENLLKYNVKYFSGSYFGKGAKKPNEIELTKTKIFAKFIKDSKKNKKI